MIYNTIMEPRFLDSLAKHFFWRVCLTFLCLFTIQTGSAKVYYFESIQMGMPFEILIHHEKLSRDRIQEIAQSAFDEINRLNQIFSNYEYDSEVSKLCRTAGDNIWVKVSDELWDVLILSHKYYDDSDGLFDVTIGSAANLWRKSRRDKRLPETHLLELVRSRIGQKYLKFHSKEKKVKLELPFMRIDLGGIAKGYALDAASRLLNEANFPSHIVKAGGDMVIGEAPGNDKQSQPGWKISLFPKQDIPDHLVKFRSLYLSQCAIGTSGDINQFVEINGIKYSHIIDPKTCFGLVGARRAVVIAENATVADSHATISCLLDQNDVIDWLQKRHLDAHILRHNGSKLLGLTTRGFWRKFKKSSSEDN